jgi:hypothetical protein
MKSGRIRVVLYLFLFLSLMMASNSAQASGCGEMLLVPVEPDWVEGEYLSAPYEPPSIKGAWTTNDPFGDPFVKVYDFTIGSDILALATLYHHAGGYIPVQYARAFVCSYDDKIVKTCRYEWTVGPLPEGLYLLINYYDPVEFKAGVYDWAVKVGNVIFGYPNVGTVEPECFSLHE